MTGRDVSNISIGGGLTGDLDRRDRLGHLQADVDSLPRGQLAPRILRAGIWAFGLRALTQVVGLVKILVLARVLAPESFGLFAMGTLMLSALEVTSQTGFQTALIQRKGRVDAYLNTAWTIQVLRGVVLAGVLAVTAPLVARFFSEPGATPLLRVFALGLLLRGCTNTGVIHFRRDLDFRGEFMYLGSGTLVDCITSVLAALLFRDARALVYGYVLGDCARMAVSYWAHPYRPRLELKLDHAKELYKFGRWVFGSGFLIFLVTQGDDILVGKIAGVAALGLYQMAYLFSNLPATQISHTVSEVTLPVFAAAQEDGEYSSTLYLATLRTVVTLALPLSALICSLASDLVVLLLGNSWVPAIPALQVLAFLGALRAIGALNGSYLMGQGAPKWDTAIAGVHTALMGILIYPLAKVWGITGAAIAATAPMIVSQLLGGLTVKRMTGSSFGDLVQVYVPPVSASLLVFILILGSRAVGASPGVTLFVCGPIALVTGVLVCNRLYGRERPSANIMRGIRRYVPRP